MELAILMSIAAIAGTVWYVYKRQKRTIAIAFEEAGKIAGLPLVILQQGERSFCFPNQALKPTFVDGIGLF